MPDLERELKELIVNSLNLEYIAPGDIDSDEPLFVKGLGLDSIDGLELGMAIRKKYGIKVRGSKQEVRAIFETVRSIARYLAEQGAGAR
jgi:acyl carrier protein